MINNTNKSNNTYRFLKALDISPKDDAFHGNFNLLDIEWWYFDAVFDNNYSAHIGFRTYHIKNSGIIQLRINIYKDGKALFEGVKPFLFSNLKTSKKVPFISIKNEVLLYFDREYFDETGQWRYNVKGKIKNYSVNLSFQGTTKGWKITTDQTCWTVSLPKAKVKGIIKIDNKDVKVNGIGYHDHNWKYSPVTALQNLGWFWGRITGDKLNITWSKTMKNYNEGDLITVLNKDNEEFYNISPKKVNLEYYKYTKSKNNSIPQNFTLKFYDEKFQIKGDILMETYDIQHTRIFTIHYWRYHVYASGYIWLGSSKEKLLSKPQIIEYLKFKSL